MAGGKYFPRTDPHQIMRDDVSLYDLLKLCEFAKTGLW